MLSIIVTEHNPNRYFSARKFLIGFTEHVITYYSYWTRIARIERIITVQRPYSCHPSNSCSVSWERKIRVIREIRVQNSTFNIITTSMDLRSYTKQELALLYFPDSDPDVARAHLMRWIVRCTQLYEQLKKSGYNKSCKEFNPLQVSYIFFHLGEPWYLSVIIGEYRWATMSIGELGKWNVVSLQCDSERRTLTI